LGDLITEIEAGRSFGGATGGAAENDWGIIKVSAMTWGEFRPEENKAVPPVQVDPRYEIHEGDLFGQSCEHERVRWCECAGWSRSTSLIAQ